MEQLTAGALRAALASVPDHTPVHVPIPLCSMDGGDGYHWAPATGTHHITDDSVEIRYQEPDEWSTQAAAERALFRQDMRYAAAFLAATRPQIRDAIGMVLEVRLAGIPDLDLDSIRDDLAVGLAGAAARHLGTP
ncbi:hypothetical protein [Streptomyces sp. NPDC020983]|uniref:hypothetical protein n=1 Tax=Streptomyces sp. NPDC020983 TaxID=3365106 RepID=UPI0037B0C803